ncbi:cholinesterase 2-like [Cydia pomonella]|uniref:cholinesterase 2-like n=1 Tax=Cydia pomonella TaxID=82600 RepID=UPI002ADD5D4D|nr:cholinesterase 2-like [Cydia pomonella]
MMKYVIAIIVCIGAVTCIDPLVLTKNGLVRGVESEDSKIDSFLGIPYAKVDVQNPFSATLNVEIFEGIYNATDDSVICPQKDDLEQTIVGTLDCLRINVYVPQGASSTNLFPVMVWIHGGGFRRWNSNRSTYGPDFLVTKGVILVTFNYRLGPYGFMSLNRSNIPGNAGLRDQLKALEWIKENIAAFNGDKNNITLFGESAGAASVEFHILSGHSKGLFHKAIMQSGTVLCDWVMNDPDTQAPIKLAKYLGLNTEDIDNALKYISKFDPHDVNKATIDIGYEESFKPIVEYEFENVYTMINDKPSNLLKKMFISIPIIIGFNSKEQQRNINYYLQSPDYIESAKKTFKAKIDNYFQLGEDELETAEKLVRYFYIGSEDMKTTVNAMIEFDSDFTFVYPSLRHSRYYTQVNSAPVFLYMFDYAGQRNYMKNRMNLTMEPGAMHADEIGYLFDQSFYTQPDSVMDRIIIERMTSMWTDFAKTSNPTPTATKVPFSWHPSATEPKFDYAVLSDRVQMAQHPFYQRMAFWDTFFVTYGKKTRW